MLGRRYLLLCCVSAFGQQQADLFEKHVRPVLATNCFQCHGKTAMGGLRLDSREHVMKGGHDGPVVIPGDPDGSLLIQAVRKTHARIKMPPVGSLSEQDVNYLAAWVKGGAAWPETHAVEKDASYWAFQPVRKPAEFTSIDQFIRSRLEAKGLKAVKPADKHALIRRATFDLIGLPPTPEEVSAFVQDTAPDAFRKVVDRLLASPHYGERWGRYWLDLARYSDGQLGASKDAPFANAYRYRDWVIQAFNEDMPYDVFVKAQIAGDLIATDASRKASARAWLLCSGTR